MTGPRVSVIVPVLNEGSGALAALRSAESAGADEIIVVDGGSTDDTRESCSACCDRLIQTEPGRAIQQNTGAARAAGDALLFLHADCRLHKDAIMAIRAAVKGDSNTVGGCFKQRIDSTRNIYRLIETGNAFRVRALCWAYGDQGIFVRKSTFEQIGGFPLIALMEDLYLMKRLKRLGRVVILPQRLTVSARRWEQRGAIRQTLHNWRLITASHLGVSPARLRQSYTDVR